MSKTKATVQMAKGNHCFENLKLHCRSFVNDDSKCVSYALYCTRHARKRMQQRGLSTALVSLALDSSYCRMAQGLEFYVVPSQPALPGIDSRDIDRIRNTVIVLNPETAEIVTVYKNDRGMRHVNKKCKKLRRHFGNQMGLVSDCQVAV